MEKQSDGLFAVLFEGILVDLYAQPWLWGISIVPSPAT
jgi:hypothetical protein